MDKNLRMGFRGYAVYSKTVKNHLVDTGGIEAQYIEIIKPGFTDEIDGEWIRRERELEV